MVDTTMISRTWLQLIRTHILSCQLQAMVAKYSSINTRKLPKALSVLTRDKKIVAMSDQGELYKMVKRYIMVSMLGAAAQVWTKQSQNHKVLYESLDYISKRIVNTRACK